MHYFSVLSIPGAVNSLAEIARTCKPPSMPSRRAYIQVPCQAFPNPADRPVTADALAPLLRALGLEPVHVKNDLGCCGAAMLDTHPDFALEYGMKRLKNIKDGGGGHVEDIIIGCGNCYRMYSDFKPSMDVEYDQAEDLDFSIHFLIHLIAEHVC